MARPFRERRQCARVRLLNRFHDRAVAVHTPFVIHDFSLGGFSVESPIMFPVGATHQFEFTTSETAPVVLTVRAKHWLRLNQPDAGASYLVGFEFVKAGADDGTAIADLMRQVLGATTPMELSLR